MATNNMELWDKVCTTKPSDTKKFKGKGGFSGTTPCAQSQRMAATGQWGPFGGKWGLRDEHYEVTPLGEDFHNAILTYRGELYYPDGSFGVFSDLDLWTYSHKYKSWNRNNDPYKKVRTDAMTKGLSELGFNADIFLGMYDDNKYVQAQMAKEAAEAGSPPEPQPTPPPEPQTAPPPQEPPPERVSAPTVGSVKRKCFEIFGEELCKKAKLLLILPDGSHFKAEDQITTMGQAKELERILNAGGLE